MQLERIITIGMRTMFFLMGYMALRISISNSSCNPTDSSENNTDSMDYPADTMVVNDCSDDDTSVSKDVSKDSGILTKENDGLHKIRKYLDKYNPL